MLCNPMHELDSGFRRNDGKKYLPTLYEHIKSKDVDFLLRPSFNSLFDILRFAFELLPKEQISDSL